MSPAVTLGPVPTDEPCAQLNIDPDYESKARTECRRYATLLARIFPKRPDGCDFTIKGHVHDAGTYYEVGVTYSDSRSERFAYSLGDKLPATWAEAERRAEAEDAKARKR